MSNTTLIQLLNSSEMLNEVAQGINERIRDLIASTRHLRDNVSIAAAPFDGSEAIGVQLHISHEMIKQNDNFEYLRDISMNLTSQLEERMNEVINNIPSSRSVSFSHAQLFCSYNAEYDSFFISLRLSYNIHHVVTFSYDPINPYPINPYLNHLPSTTPDQSEIRSSEDTAIPSERPSTCAEQFQRNNQHIPIQKSLDGTYKASDSFACYRRSIPKKYLIKHDDKKKPHTLTNKKLRKLDI